MLTCNEILTDTVGSVDESVGEGVGAGHSPPSARAWEGVGRISNWLLFYIHLTFICTLVGVRATVQPRRLSPPAVLLFPAPLLLILVASLPS